MTFWRGETLAAKLPNLVQPFDQKRIDCSAYTLSVGSEIYVTPNHEVPSPSTNTVRKLSDCEGFTIPSGQFGFIITDEVVEIPDDAMAFISMKTFIKFQGLINASGFHVDPGFKGKLIFSVFNAGPTSIHLKQGDQLFLIWFASLDGQTKEKKSGLYQDQIPAKLVKSIDGKIHSPHSLSEEINVIKEKYHLIEKASSKNSLYIKLIFALAVGAFLIPFRKEIFELLGGG